MMSEYDLPATEADTAESNMREFRALLPSLLLHLMARAQPFANCEVHPKGEHWEAHFRFYDSPMENRSVTPDIEEWEYEVLVGTVEEFEEEERKKKESLVLAREAFDLLSPAQRLAVGLAKRP